jgi:kynurenine formamidase
MAESLTLPKQVIRKRIDSMRVFTAILILAAPLAAKRHPAIDPTKVIDLSYPFDRSTLYWPTSPPFAWNKDTWGKDAQGKWYASATFTTSEHGGTHIDSPIHFAEGQPGTADIAVRQLIGTAAVIDVTTQASRNPDYLLTTADLERWESRHGRLTSGDIVLIRTGWGKRWPDAKSYLGTDKRGDTANLRFPGISEPAARRLAARRVKGVGIDAASIDYGSSKDFLAHRVLNGAGIYALENIANLERLPETGATLIALPVKIAGGSGGPVRIIAILP